MLKTLISPFDSEQINLEDQGSLLSQSQQQRLLIGLLLSSGIGLVAYKRRSLSPSGIIGAILTGTSIFGLAGTDWGFSLIFFFASSSLLSHFRAADKQVTAEDKFSKGSQRDFSQVMGSGGLAALVAILYGLARTESQRDLLKAGFTGILATANADTWATELGVLSPWQPRLITTGKSVPAGTSGGITATGTAASAGGALAQGLFAWLVGRQHRKFATLPVIAAISGLGGSFFDSLLGATVQAMYYCPACQKETERRIHTCGTRTQPLRGLSWMNNELVNLLATVCGGLIAVGLRKAFHKQVR